MRGNTVEVSHLSIIVIGLLLSGFMPRPVRAVEVRATAAGLEIDAGTAGIHVMSYPRLLTPNDQGLTPENIQLKPDGSGATMSYTPSGTLALDRQAGGSWVFHFTDIPSDRVKFSFGIRFPLTVSSEGAKWSFDGLSAKPFPKEKGELALYQGNPGGFIFQKDRGGFSIAYPQKTWTQLIDQRAWGKSFFSLGHCLYFPGKKTVPEITCRLVIGDAPEPNKSPTPSPAAP